MTLPRRYRRFPEEQGVGGGGRLKNNRAKRQKLDCDKHDVTLRKLRACVRAGKEEGEREREGEDRIIDVYFAYSTKSRVVSVEGKQLFLVCFRLDDRRKEMKKEKGRGCMFLKRRMKWEYFLSFLRFFFFERGGQGGGGEGCTIRKFKRSDGILGTQLGRGEE